MQLGLLFQVIQTLLRAEALVRRPALQELIDMLRVNRQSLGLKYRSLIPSKPEKFKRLLDIIGSAFDLAGAVRILDAQNEFAAVLAGEKKIKKRGAQSADMQKSGWRWGESDSDNF